MKRRVAMCAWVLLVAAISAPAQQNNPAIAARLRQVAAAGRLQILRWPNFSDYRKDVQSAYEQANWSLLWIGNGQPSAQAQVMMQAFANAKQKGLKPDDYDGARWQQRVSELRGASAESQADFDAAMTVSTMRYISDLHIGRVDPAHFKFDISEEGNKYDLPKFVLGEVVHAQNLPAVLDGVEPQYAGYKRTEAALDRYEAMAAKGDGPLVPGVTKTIAPGEAYPGTRELAERLKLLGDLPPDAAVGDAGTYSGALVDAVKKFQDRHGLTADGKLGAATVKQLNVPLAFRVQQLEDALERWRWLPPNFPAPPVVVNIPEFVLRAFDANHTVGLQMNVVVGRAMRTQTPVFAETMKYIVFRPYWNVPRSITRNEIVPSIEKNRGYLAAKGFEVTNAAGTVVSSGAVSDATLAGLKSGALSVRQKPGNSNSLGLVKFIFPNTNNVYMHDTPAKTLFSQSRRDFSHGCIRLQKPTELAIYLLRNQGWDADKVKAAMQSGQNDRQVNLSPAVPVLILYITAVVEPDNSVHFYDDIYGHDKSLNAVLAKGMPYPG